MTTPTDPEPAPADDHQTSPPQPLPEPAAEPTAEPAAPAPRRLTRSHDDRMVAGVAGGIAEYFDLDPSLVRIAIVVLALFTSGVGILLYLGAWLVLPEADRRQEAAAGAAAAAELRSRRRRRRRGTPALIWGALLIVVGALLLAQQADVTLPPLEGILAGVLVLVGLLILIESRRGLNSGLLVLAILVSVGLATFAKADVSYDGAFSERNLTISRVEDLDDSYGHAFGKLQLDLRGVTFPEGTTEMTVSVAFGSAEIRVPRDVPVRIEGTTLFGSSQVRGQEIPGFGVDTGRSDSTYDGASKRLLIHVTTLFGSTEVQ